MELQPPQPVVGCATDRDATLLTRNPGRMSFECAIRVQSFTFFQNRRVESNVPQSNRSIRKASVNCAAKEHFCEHKFTRIENTEY